MRKFSQKHHSLIKWSLPNAAPANTLCLEDLGQLGDDGVTDLLGAGAAAEVLRAQTVVDDGLDGVLDGLGLLGQVEGVAEHHGDGEDGANGVDDALAGDIGGRACQLN